MDGRMCGRAAARRAVARRVVRPLARRVRAAGDRVRGACRDAGMATAEYAMVTLAAVGFAGLLAVILKSDEVRGFLTDLVHRALSQ